MKLSIVVSTLNNREHLIRCLDAIESQAPSDAECIVVNGPSSDGTTGAIRDRSDVDVLVEISERNRNVSRNAGFARSTGDAVAFIGDRTVVEPNWFNAVESALSNGADVVTGPTGGSSKPSDIHETICGRTVSYFDGDHVALRSSVVRECDGFDEYLSVVGDKDCADRIANLGFSVVWLASMKAVVEPAETDIEWGIWYRSYAYRLFKNYGVRPGVLRRVIGTSLADGYTNLRAMLAGKSRPTQWLGNGTDVIANAIIGSKDGLIARYADRSPKRNPHGLTSRRDRAVEIYDRR